MRYKIYFLIILLIIIPVISTNAASNWSKLNFPDNLNSDITSLDVVGGNIFVGTEFNGMFLSTDAGITFNNIAEDLSRKMIGEIIVRNNHLYAVADGDLYMSENGGLRWKMIGLNLPNEEKIQCIFISPKEEILAGTNQALYLSNDWGEKWLSLTVRLKSVNCLAITMNEQGYIFLSFSRYRETYDIYRSPNWGETWEESEKGIEELPVVTSFALRGNNVYAAIFNSVYLTGNNGDNWIRIPSTFQYPIRKLEVSKDEYLVARFDDFISIYDKEKNEWILDDEEMIFKDTVKASDTDDDDYVYIATKRELYKSLGDLKIFVNFYPRYTITLKDINNSAIQNKLFYIIKNGYNIGSVTTNSSGEFYLSASNGDTIKVEHYPGGYAAAKAGHNTCNGNTMYYIILDNAKFSGTGVRSYYALGTDYNPIIIVDHTTIKMSLIVSLEWEAKRSYMDSLALWFKQLSNYYYDVTDGQLCFHQIDIYDNRQKWNDCDVRVWCDNMVWPNASVGGIFSNNTDHHANMPRKWYGNTGDTRNLTERNDWLTTYNGYHWTTIGHELGHYMMAFYDEYVYVGSDGSGLPNGYNYGFMDYQYPNGGVWSREMSNPTRYPNNTYKITAQWVYNGSDCWNDFENDYEKSYNGVFCPIIKPSERVISGGLTYLPGPNIDVGNNLITNVYDANNSSGDVNITVLDPNMTILTRAKVDLYKNYGIVTLVMKQGQAADNGNFKVLGANVGDAIRISHFLKIQPYLSYSYVYDVTSVTGAEKQGDITQQDEYIPVVLRQVDGIYNRVNTFEYGQTGNLLFKSYVNKEFTQASKLEVQTGQDNIQMLDLSFNRGKLIYDCILDENIKSNGVLSIEGYDDNQRLFYIPINYSITGYSPILSGPNGDVNLYLDQRNSQISKFAIITSISQTSRNGLDADAEQSGNVHSIATYPYPVSTEIPSILQIGYSPDELINKTQSLLRIFKWDETSLLWKNIGGQVDSIRHYVRVPISETGTFAVFTSNNPESIDDGFNYHNINITPNPCDDKAYLNYTNIADEIVTISLFNYLGYELDVLSSNTYLSSGNHKLEINTSGLSSGTYFIKINTATETFVVKFIVLR